MIKLESCINITSSEYLPLIVLAKQGKIVLSADIKNNAFFRLHCDLVNIKEELKALSQCQDVMLEYLRDLASLETEK